MSEEKSSGLPEKVRFNDNAAVVAKLQAVLKQNGGYCPCRLRRIPDNLCICKEFREQIADPEFEGFCHCHLYYKEK